MIKALHINAVGIYFSYSRIFVDDTVYMHQVRKNEIGGTLFECSEKYK